MWIVPWDPFLMKFLLKKEVCKSREQYTGPSEKHWNALLNEKKVWNARHGLHYSCGSHLWKRQNTRIEKLSKRVLRMCLDSVYFTENWKHYNKIIFIYVNNAVRPILNESFIKKKRFVSPVNSTGPLKKPQP